VLVDSAQSVLLLTTRDASDPGFGTSWELPGGGIARGEEIAEAAVREVREETGFSLPVADIGLPLWHRDVLYTYRGERRLQREAICRARITGLAPRIDDAGREAIEREDHLLYRWWRADELRASEERFYPRSLPQHIDALIAGLHVEEPLETWDE
jgi:8-oxo-dGTP pyrophosphatase MutT (NUDIX family)